MGKCKDKIRTGLLPMDRMLVVIFEDEGRALDGKRALEQLDGDGSITVYAYAVLGKNANGTAIVKQSEDFGPPGTVAANSLRSLVELLSPQLTSEIGAAAGTTAREAATSHHGRLGADFIEELMELFLPWRFAVVAEVAERWTTPVDSHMEGIGGVVVRRALSPAKYKLDADDIIAIKADMAQLQAERAVVDAERKAKLEERIERLGSKLRAQFERAKEKCQAAELEAQAKLFVLKRKETGATKCRPFRPDVRSASGTPAAKAS